MATLSQLSYKAAIARLPSLSLHAPPQPFMNLAALHNPHHYFPTFVQGQELPGATHSNWPIPPGAWEPCLLNNTSCAPPEVSDVVSTSGAAKLNPSEEMQSSPTQLLDPTQHVPQTARKLSFTDLSFDSLRQQGSEADQASEAGTPTQYRRLKNPTAQANGATSHTPKMLQQLKAPALQLPMEHVPQNGRKLSFTDMHFDSLLQQGLEADQASEAGTPHSAPARYTQSKHPKTTDTGCNPKAPHQPLTMPLLSPAQNSRKLSFTDVSFDVLLLQGLEADRVSEAGSPHSAPARYTQRKDPITQPTGSTNHTPKLPQSSPTQLLSPTQYVPQTARKLSFTDVSFDSLRQKGLEADQASGAGTPCPAPAQHLPPTPPAASLPSTTAASPPAAATTFEAAPATSSPVNPMASWFNVHPQQQVTLGPQIANPTPDVLMKLGQHAFDSYNLFQHASSLDHFVYTQHQITSSFSAPLWPAYFVH